MCLPCFQVNRQVYPEWTYSTLVVLVPVLLVTDFLRYKPVIIVQGLTYVCAFLLVLVSSSVHWVQLAFFSYSIAMAADVAYFSYIYSVVHPRYYQRVTSGLPYCWATLWVPPWLSCWCLWLECPCTAWCF